LVVWGGRGVGEGGDRNPPSLIPRGSGGGVTPRWGAWGQRPQKTEGYPELRLISLIKRTQGDLGSRGRAPRKRKLG
jgi:hypothetical protein